jgi:hypothetical protein
VNIPDHAFMTAVSSDERQHVLDGDCWCNPQFAVPCSECDASAGGCWRCEQGWRTVDAAEAEVSDGPQIVLHRNATDHVGDANKKAGA